MSCTGDCSGNEEVVDGKYVETGDIVERKMMKQWMLKITAYAQRLLDDLDGLDWPVGVLEMQRQWIGRSEGARLKITVAEQDVDFEVYTTRPDTLWGNLLRPCARTSFGDADLYRRQQSGHQ